MNYGCPEMGWRYDRSTMARLIAEKRILWPSDPDGRPRRKAFLAELSSEFTGFSTIVGEDIFTNDGTADVDGLFDARIFNFPKPVPLIRSVVEQGTNADDIVLDFFAGSGTTAHAVMAQNAADRCNRRYIMVQLPEVLDPSNRDQKTAADFCDKLKKPRNIAELTKERLRRAGKKVQQENSLFAGDFGFRTFKLDQSNFTTWDAGMRHEPEALQRQLELHVDHIRDGRTPDDILYELLLKSGFPLTTPVEKVTFPESPGSPHPDPLLKGEGKVVYSVAGGAMAICLDRELTLDLIRAIAERKPERVVCLDEGFAGNDQLKANAVQIFKTKGVTSFKTV